MRVVELLYNTDENNQPIKGLFHDLGIAPMVVNGTIIGATVAIVEFNNGKIAPVALELIRFVDKLN